MKRVKKYLENIKQWLIQNIRHILYSSIAFIGIAFLILSFFVKNNWSNVLCGVGTGLLTSLVVSIIINSENDARLKKKLEEDKRFVLNDIVYASKDVYIDIIYRINEYIMFQDNSLKSIYRVY